MRRKQLASARQTRTVTREKPAPLRGINRVDSVTSLSGKANAQVIDNMICRPSGLVVRPGFVTDLEGDTPVTSLLPHKDTYLTRTDGLWHGDRITNAGGSYTAACEAKYEDTGDTLVGQSTFALPQVYTGTAWQDMTLTGVDNEKLEGFVRYGRRLWGWLHDQLTLVYLEPGAVGGEVKKLPVTPAFPAGGRIVALGVAKNNGGEGEGNDTLCAVTNKGELAVWSGINPNFREQWNFAGTFDIPKPIGRRCFMKLGGSLAIMTEKGLFTVRSIMNQAKSEQPMVAVDRDLGDIPAAAIHDSRTHEFTMIHCGDHQYVRDPETKGWSRFLNLDATQWIDTPNGLYFADSIGNVNKLEREASDGTQTGSDSQQHPVPIKTLLIDAFSPMGSQANKVFHRTKLHLDMVQPYQVRSELIVDYRGIPETGWDAARISHRYWFWDDITWDNQPKHWLREKSPRLGQWRTTVGEGMAAALVLGAQWLQSEGTFIGATYEFEQGGR